MSDSPILIGSVVDDAPPMPRRDSSSFGSVSIAPSTPPSSSSRRHMSSSSLMPALNIDPITPPRLTSRQREIPRSSNHNSSNVVAAASIGTASNTPIVNSSIGHIPRSILIGSPAGGIVFRGSPARMSSSSMSSSSMSSLSSASIIQHHHPSPFRNRLGHTAVGSLTSSSLSSSSSIVGPSVPAGSPLSRSRFGSIPSVSRVPRVRSYVVNQQHTTASATKSQLTQSMISQQQQANNALDDALSSQPSSSSTTSLLTSIIGQQQSIDQQQQQYQQHHPTPTLYRGASAENTISYSIDELPFTPDPSKIHHEAPFIGDDNDNDDHRTAALPSSPSTSLLVVAASPLLRAYTLGQISNVLKLGVAWCSFGPLFLALLGGRVYGVSCTRIAFNTGMLLASPFAAIVVERLPARRILMSTSLLRGVIYVILLPCAWVFFATEWFVTGLHHPEYNGEDGLTRHAHDGYLDGYLYLLLAFVLLTFVDGLVVAVSNCCDIDCEGGMLIARQYALQLDVATRATMSRWHNNMFEISMILLTPMLALGVEFSCDFVTDAYGVGVGKMQRDYSGCLFLLAIGLLFLITTTVSMCYYYQLPVITKDQLEQSVQSIEDVNEYTGLVTFIPSTSQSIDPSSFNHNDHKQSLDHTVGDVDLSYDDDHVGPTSVVNPNDESSITTVSSLSHAIPPSSSIVRVSVAREMLEVFSSLSIGARLCWHCSPIRTRLWLLAMHTAVEDGLISIIIPTIAQIVLDRMQGEDSDGDRCRYGWSSVLAICLMSAGKIASIVAAKARLSLKDDTIYRWSYSSKSHFVGVSMLASCLCLLLYPAALFLLDSSADANLWSGSPTLAEASPPSRFNIVLSICLLFVGTFLFFLLSSPPRFLLAMRIQGEALGLAQRVELQVQRRRDAEHQAEAEDEDRQNVTIAQHVEDDDDGEDVYSASLNVKPSLDLDPVLPASFTCEVDDVSRPIFGFVALLLTFVDSLFLAVLCILFQYTASVPEDQYRCGIISAVGVIVVHGLLAMCYTTCGRTGEIDAEDDNANVDELSMAAARKDSNEEQERLEMKKSSHASDNGAYHQSMQDDEDDMDSRGQDHYQPMFGDDFHEIAASSMVLQPPSALDAALHSSLPIDGSSSSSSSGLSAGSSLVIQRSHLGLSGSNGSTSSNRVQLPRSLVPPSDGAYYPSSAHSSMSFSYGGSHRNSMMQPSSVLVVSSEDGSMTSSLSRSNSIVSSQNSAFVKR